MRSKLADTEGFEPSKDREALASLAGRWFQPLTHVSAFWLVASAAGGAIARGLHPCNGYCSAK